MIYFPGLMLTLGCTTLDAKLIREINDVEKT